MAPHQSPGSEGAAAGEAVASQRVDRVLRARRVVLAGRREERAEGRAVGPDAAGGDLRQAGAPRLPELPLDPVPDDGAAGPARDGEADPRRAVVVAGKRVEDEEAGLDRAAVPVDRVEVARAREAMPALHVDPRAGWARQAERRLRPFARRRLRIARPARVAIRARKPCRRFRRRTFGW